jgi:hypothetical protein
MTSLRMTLTSIQRILLLLCIAAVMFYVLGVRTLEGFIAPVQPVQGMLPVAKQSSMIPRDSASATTGDPQLAKPDYRDWANARENLLYFLEAYRPAIADAESQEMVLNAPRYLQQIEAYIRNPEAVPSRDLLDRGFEAQVLADRMRLVRSC